MVPLPEVIETAYVAIRPDTRGFAAETRQQVRRSLPAGGGRDIVPPIGVRGTAIKGLVGLGTTLTGVTAATVGLTLAVRAGYNEFTEAQKVFAQTEQTIKSTGGVAGVTAKEAKALSESLNSISGIDDEVILQGENLLLTFKNVRNVVGEGNDIFDRATKAALDLSVKGFGSVSATSKQMGKALNDPIKGMTALSRAGVTFSGKQKAAIKAMVENNNVMGAQKLILKEVESQVGGSAEAYGRTLPAALGRLSNSFSELIASGIGKIAPALTDGANAVSGFFDDLNRGGEFGQIMADAADATGRALKPLFAAIKAEGPRIVRIFKGLADIVRQAMPVLKLVGTIIGVALVVSFKLLVRQIEILVKVWKFTQGVFVTGVRWIIAAFDKLLGAASSVGDALNTILPGDPFAGATDSINVAREALRGFSEELDAANGKQVNVDVNVNTNYTTTGMDAHGRAAMYGPHGAGSNVPGAAPATAPTADLAPTTTTAEGPGPRQKREVILQANLSVARETRQTLADDRAALNALIAFYSESVRIAKAKGQGYRQFLASKLSAQNELRDINQGVIDAQQQAADEAKRTGEELRQAALDERRATLEANVRIAALSKNNLKDDKIAYAALIKFLKGRVAAAKAAKVGIAAAVAELKEAKQAIRDILRDAAEARLDERETLLEGAVELASFTERTSDDEKALRRLIAFYKKRVKDEKLSAVERQKYKIALARTRKDLRDLNEEQSSAEGEAASFGRQSFQFLQTLKGFTSNLASNILPKGYVANLTETVTTAAKEAAAAASSIPSVVGEKDPLAATYAGMTPSVDSRAPSLYEHGRGRGAIAQKGKDAATVALENREKQQGPATAAQFERLLSLEQQQLRILRRIAQDQDHPGAKFNRKSSPSATVTGVA